MLAICVDQVCCNHVNPCFTCCETVYSRIYFLNPINIYHLRQGFHILMLFSQPHRLRNLNALLRRSSTDTL
jgi:hypothetical protein